MANDMNRVIRAAEEQGWTVDRTRTNHLRFTAPDGRKYTTSSTPSDRRTLQNTIAQLRRMGLIYDTHRGSRAVRRKTKTTGGRAA